MTDRYTSDTLTQQRLDNEERCISIARTLLEFADHWPRKDRVALANAINAAKVRVDGLRNELGLPLGE